MKETHQQENLPGVPLAKQGREVALKWAWTEASVWTERMLATLERGIKGNKWYSFLGYTLNEVIVGLARRALIN